ncbi:acetyltransferase [Yoonia sp.]|uniref:acetyltransferase n=1 Tax=Yoonia sp. TaxID=2212373 RepID=UPI0025E55032|nr:acetyltransferase [Yoonia sp.]
MSRPSWDVQQGAAPGQDDRLVIVGAGGHGKVVADIAALCGYGQIVFVDDAWPNRTQNGCWPIVGCPTATGDSGMFCAVGDNAIRSELFEKLALAHSPKLLHPSTIISPTAQIGAGTVAMATVVINADATIGRGVILNTGCSIDHDCAIADFAHISPGARLAGGVRVGARSWIGIGAVVREGITIGNDVIVGAGAAVVRDIKDGAQVAGVPARQI